MEVASTIQPYKGEPCASNEDFNEDWLRRFLHVVFRSSLEQKNPATECLVCWVSSQLADGPTRRRQLANV